MHFKPLIFEISLELKYEYQTLFNLKFTKICKERGLSLKASFCIIPSERSHWCVPRVEVYWTKHAGCGPLVALCFLVALHVDVKSGAFTESLSTLVTLDLILLSALVYEGLVGLQLSRRLQGLLALVTHKLVVLFVGAENVLSKVPLLNLWR